MSSSSVRLHAKLYRAKAVDQAMALLGEVNANAELTRKRQGDYHVVTISGIEQRSVAEILAEIADSALLITVELDRR